jgi:hypothetical protein
MRPLFWMLLLPLLAPARDARAQERSPTPNAPSLPGPQPAGLQPGPVPLESESAAVEAPLADPEEQRWVQYEQQLQELRERLQQAEDERKNTVSPLTLSGYVDLGFFAPLGNNGVGWVRDVGNRQFPELSNYSWVFLGDILGTPINSRGEAADLGDAPDVDRFDSVDSDGAPGFIANELNLSIGYTLAESAILRTSLNFMPRTATQDFAIGDFVDIDQAELEYVLPGGAHTSLFVGKILPVFGIEYKDRKSNQRFGITPSLVARYTTGSQLGVKLRSKLFDDWLVLAASLTNNSSTVEQFHFYREIDRNVGKTLNGRVALSVPVRGFELLDGDRIEVGASGEWGAQDNDTRSDREIWFAGADLEYQSTNFSLKAQIMRGKAPGAEEQRVWSLNLHTSGYVELDWQVHPRFGFLLRGDRRNALVHLGTERAYKTDQARFTGGARWLFNPHVIAKAEYLHNQELGGMDQFNNDMFTSSLLLIY